MAIRLILNHRTDCLEISLNEKMILFFRQDLFVDGQLNNDQFLQPGKKVVFILDTLDPLCLCTNQMSRVQREY